MAVLPWIQSTGTQYIDTGIIGGNGIDVELCVFFTESFSDWHFLIGSRLANVDHSYAIGIQSLRKITIQRGNNIWYDASYAFSLNTDYTIKVVGTHLYINGEDICSVSDQSFESPVSMYLFAANLNGRAEAFIPMSVKYCKIWENGVLVRDYIPTIDNGRIGLWDNVSGSFFSDATGGDFITTKWYVDSEGNLTNDELQEFLPSMEKPYPLSLWRVENGVLTNGLLAKFPADAGAFENASRLSRVAIPESVKTIGDSAFRGTALTVVRIAADCTFGEGSFPENCRILRYPAHTHGQITDGSGRAVLDRQGRRIYARRIDNG